MSTTEGVPDRYEPADVVEVELGDPLPDLSGTPGAVLAVVRLCGRPLGMVALPAGPGPDELLAAVTDRLQGALSRAAAEHGPLPALTAAGLPHGPCPVRDTRTHVRATSPGVTVVLCTRDRPVELARALESLLALQGPAYEVVVVDNAPPDDRTRQVCASFAGRLPLRHLVEPRPGLSHARNTGVAAARHDVVAFLDDDERVDPLWLLGLAAEFADPAVGAVSGLVLPAELATAAQAQFEQVGGHSKGRGFTRVVYDRAYQRRVQSPLYPLPPFGVGANMAFRTLALRQAGGFDPALGAGSPTSGAEDTAAFTEVMLAGWTMVYAPDAVTWHYHRDGEQALAAQLTGYGLGLGAYYTALVLRDPRRLAPLLGLVPRAARDLRRPPAGGTASAPLPPGVLAGNRRAVLTGPGRYLKARRALARSGA